LPEVVFGHQLGTGYNSSSGIMGECLRQAQIDLICLYAQLTQSEAEKT